MHTGLSHSCNANTSAPRADPVANASAYRLGRTHNPMPARVMKKELAEVQYSKCAVFARAGERAIWQRY
jgi:hypothetical protein